MGATACSARDDGRSPCRSPSTSARYGASAGQHSSCSPTGLTIEPTWEGRGDEEGEPGRAVVTTPALAPVTPQMPLDLEGMIDALAADPIAPSLALPSTLTAEERKRAKSLVAQYTGLRCESFGLGSERRLHIYRVSSPVARKDVVSSCLEAADVETDAAQTSTTTETTGPEKTAEVLELSSKCVQHNGRPPDLQTSSACSAAEVNADVGGSQGIKSPDPQDVARSVFWRNQTHADVNLKTDASVADTAASQHHEQDTHGSAQFTFGHTDSLRPLLVASSDVPTDVTGKVGTATEILSSQHAIDSVAAEVNQTREGDILHETEVVCEKK